MLQKNPRVLHNTMLKKNEIAFEFVFFLSSICALVLKKDGTESLEIIHVEYTDESIWKPHCQMLTSLH